MSVEVITVYAGLPSACGARDGEWLTHSKFTDQMLASCQGGYTKPLVRCTACVAIVEAPVAVAPVDDGFNGSCLRCGLRTYMGCTPAGFEHQGGPCRGRP